jgi:hypothetical protein
MGHPKVLHQGLLFPHPTRIIVGRKGFGEKNTLAYFYKEKGFNI